MGILALGTAVFFGNVPPATATDLAGCTFHFNVKIKSVLIFQSGVGDGYLSCKDIHGRESRDIVDIQIQGIGLGLGLFYFEGVSGNLGVLDAQDLEGEYYLADGNIAIGVGGGLSVGLYNRRNGLSIDAKVKGGRGIGAAINGSRWTITLVRP